jgi:hypothetical protein
MAICSCALPGVIRLRVASHRQSTCTASAGKRPDKRKAVSANPSRQTSLPSNGEIQSVELLCANNEPSSFPALPIWTNDQSCCLFQSNGKP